MIRLTPQAAMATGWAAAGMAVEAALEAGAQEAMEGHLGQGRLVGVAGRAMAEAALEGEVSVAAALEAAATVTAARAAATVAGRTPAS